MIDQPDPESMRPAAAVLGEIRRLVRSVPHPSAWLFTPKNGSLVLTQCVLATGRRATPVPVVPSPPDC